MSEINISMQLSTILKAIEDGNKTVLTDVIGKLLMADFELSKQISEIGTQLASLIAELKRISEEDE